jgi:hypothetical protein
MPKFFSATTGQLKLAPCGFLHTPHTSAVTRSLLRGKKTDAHTPHPALLTSTQRILTCNELRPNKQCGRLQLRMLELLHDIVAGCRKDWLAKPKWIQTVLVHI